MNGATSPWKVRTLLVLVVCLIIVVLSLLVDQFPRVLTAVLAPGFIVAILVNMLFYGSLHEGIMRGYIAIAAFTNCVVYSAVALFGRWLFKVIRQSR
jgi:hypothetical protein